MTVARTFRTAGIRPSSVPIWSRLSPAGPSFLRNLLFSHPAKVSCLITINVNIRFSRALAFLPARNNNTHTKKKYIIFWLSRGNGFFVFFARKHFIAYCAYNIFRSTWFKESVRYAFITFYTGKGSLLSLIIKLVDDGRYTVLSIFYTKTMHSTLYWVYIKLTRAV